jgi:phospholipid/cholesterol/gamma-HCH transport system substrate-binding protein
MSMSRAQATAKAREQRLPGLGLAAIAIVLLIVVLAYLRPDPFAGHGRMQVVFDDVAGVGIVGAEVRVAGVPVGRIAERRLVGDDALVTLELDEDAPSVHQDARAALRPRTAFEGTAFVDLDPGSSNASLLDGSPLPKERTRNYVSLDHALRFARPSTRKALQQGVHELAAALSGGGAQGVNRTLRQAPRVTESLERVARAAQGPTGDELAGAVSGFSRTAHTVATRRTELVPMLRSAERSLAAVATDSSAPLDSLIAELPARLEALESGGRALEGVVERLEPLAADLQPGLRELDPALREAAPLLEEARPVLAKAPPLVRDLRQTLDRGAASTPAARALIGKLQPTLDLLDASLVPALRKRTPLGRPAYLQFFSLFQGGGGSSRPFQTPADGGQPFENSGTGHYMRFGARFFTGLGAPAPPCGLLEQANPRLAEIVSDQGFCTP